MIDNMEIFLDEETADLTFDVKGSMIPLHRCILKSQAKDLYILAGERSVKHMPISDVEPDIFKMMLCTLYGGFILPEEWQQHSKVLLEAADKYAFDNVKEEADMWYAKSLKFTVDNVIDELLEADGKGYTAVREAAMQFIVENGKEIVMSESFDRLYESKSLVKEVMAAIADDRKRKRED